MDDNSNGTPRVVTYQFLPPGGTWDFADNGTYSVALQANEVKSTAATAVPAVTLGSFKVGFAGTYLVTNANDSGPGSLRDAIINSNSTPGLQDTILFDPSFFNGSMKTVALASTLPFFTDSVTITGPGAGLATIDGQSKIRLFNFDPAPQGALFMVSGLTLAHGSTTGNGGAIMIGDENVTLQDMVVQNNKAAEGGAITVEGAATLNVLNSTISGNTAVAEDGGAINVNGAAYIVVTASTLSGNSASSDGGAIYFAFNGSLVVTRSTISGNTASGIGGSFNSGGGGIYFYGTAIGAGFVISNSTISGNTHTSLTGGGIHLEGFSGTAQIINSTIVGNKGSDGGGIAKTGSGLVLIISSIVAGNTTAGGPALDLLAGPAEIIATNSAVGTDAAGTLNSYDTGDNIPLGTPLNLGPLANNGGPTLTHLPGPGSPLIDSGANPMPLFPDVDQIGNSRTFGLQTDIGAVEVQAIAPVVTGFIVNNGDLQRSRLTTITVNFASPVDAAQFQAAGAVTLTRTAATSSGVVGTIVNLANGLVVAPTSGSVTSITLTFANLVNAGVENGSLADGRWQLAVVPAGFTSTAGSTQLRRLFGDSNNDGTVDGTDFGNFGSVFGLTLANSPFDDNADGTVDGTDFAQFGARFGLTL